MLKCVHTYVGARSFCDTDFFAMLGVIMTCFACVLCPSHPTTLSCFFCLSTRKGLADAFIKMRLPFESEEASTLNRDIFETIYFGAVNASVEVRTPRPVSNCALPLDGYVCTPCLWCPSSHENPESDGMYVVRCKPLCNESASCPKFVSPYSRN